MTASKPLDSQIRSCELYVKRRIERVAIIDKTAAALQLERASLSREAGVARKTLRSLQQQKMRESASLRLPSAASVHSDLIKELALVQHPEVQRLVLKYGVTAEPIMFDLSESESDTEMVPTLEEVFVNPDSGVDLLGSIEADISPTIPYPPVGPASSPAVPEAPRAPLVLGPSEREIAAAAAMGKLGNPHVVLQQHSSLDHAALAAAAEAAAATAVPGDHVVVNVADEESEEPH